MGVCLLMGAFFVTQGHAADVTESKGLPAGFVSLTHDGDKTIRGIFEVNGVKLMVETHRGSAIAPIVRKMDPSAPTYEIDIRITDETGFPYFTQFGGHGYDDSPWEKDMDFRNEVQSEERATKAVQLYGVAESMISSLEKARFTHDLEPERKALMGVLPLIKEAMITEKIEMETTEETGPLPVTFMDRQSIEIWKKPITIYVPSSLSGEHSGTVAKAISAAGCATQIWSACNHGTCPGGTHMTKKCTSTFFNRPGICVASPNCSTPLQWNQRDYWNDDYRHVCNDDTYIQYYRIKNNANPSTSSGTCSDTSLRRWAPDCW